MFGNICLSSRLSRPKILSLKNFKVSKIVGNFEEIIKVEVHPSQDLSCSILGISEYNPEYVQLPKHPVPKEDVTGPPSSLFYSQSLLPATHDASKADLTKEDVIEPPSSLFYSPHSQSLLPTPIQGSVIEMESPGL